MGCVFFSEQEYEYIVLKQLQITQYSPMCISQDDNR
jgi:hypothetical protein